jgi:hypothetical protein
MLRSRAVGLLQFAFEELAGLGAGELLDEVDGTRCLEMRQSLADVADDLLAELVAGFETVLQLRHGSHLIAHFRLGHSDHRDIDQAGMRGPGQASRGRPGRNHLRR